jgi:putative membrane protein
MWQMHDGWGWWMVFGWLWMIVFWGLIIWVVYAVIERLEGRPADQAPRDEGTAMEILQRRYARGELATEQFEEMRRRLTESGGPMASSV